MTDRRTASLGILTALGLALAGFLGWGCSPTPKPPTASRVLFGAAVGGGGSSGVGLAGNQTVGGLKTFRFDAVRNGSAPFDLASPPSLAVVAATTNTGHATVKIGTANAVGAGTGHATVDFFDGTSEAGRLVAAVGNSPASNRYLGLVSGTDRDGTRVPVEVWTTDSAGAAQRAMHIDAGQTPGSGGLTTLYGGLAVGPVTTAGSVAAGTFTGDGSAISNINGSNVASGTVPMARLGTGPANSTTVLFGDGVLRVPPSGGGGSTPFIAAGPSHAAGYLPDPGATIPPRPGLFGTDGLYTAPGKVASGIRTADVRDFGAIPTDQYGNGPDNALAFQAAADSLYNAADLAAGRANSSPGVLRIPSGQWNCISPVFLPDLVQVVGEGAIATTVTATNISDAPFMFGTRRAEPTTGVLSGSALYPSMHRLVTNKQLTSNVAILTAAAHPYVVGVYLTVKGLGPPFDGTVQVTAVTTNTFSYACLGANVAGEPMVTQTQLTGGTAICTVASHPYTVGSSIVVTSAIPPYNGSWTVTATTSTSFSFALASGNLGVQVMPVHEANWPLDFAPSHRFLLDNVPFADTSCNGRGLYGVSSVMPGSPAVDMTTGGALADHFLLFNDLPPAFGAHDSWGTAASNQLTIQCAVKGIGGAALGHGPIMGMGTTQQQPLVSISPWILTAGDWTNNTFAGIGADANKYHFYFYTNPVGIADTNQSPRRFAFGDTTATGWQHISIKINFAATDPNDPSGCCEIAAFVNGTQVVVTRQYGTRNTTPTGVAGSTGEPAFVAADGLLWKENPFSPFCVFAQSVDMLRPVNGEKETGRGFAGGILKAQLGGLRIDLGTSPLQNNGVTTAEKLVSPNAVPTYYQKYFDTSVAPSTMLCYLPLNDPLHNAAVNSDRLVSIYLGAAAQGGYHAHGLFAWDEVLESSANVQLSQALRNITVQSGPTWGAALQCSNNFHFTGENVVVNGGWTGARLSSGYDYLFSKLGGYGSDSILTGLNANIQVHNLDRQIIGNTMLRFACCKAKVDEIRAGAYNTQGMTTKTYVACHGTAGQYSYNSEYRFRGFELDNESGAGPTRAIFYVERNPAFFSTSLAIEEVHAEGIANSNVPVVWLADNGASVGAIGDFGPSVGAGYGMGYADISRLNGADGFMVKTDGPAWRGRLHDSLAAERTGSPNIEPVRVTGASGLGNFIAEWAAPQLPRVGRYGAGACEITIRNPGIGAAAYNAGTTYTQGAYVVSSGLTYTATAAASNVGHTPASSPTYWTPGAVRKYLCVGSGTAAWDAGTSYFPSNTVSSAGTEYTAINATLNDPPVGSANWTAGVGAVAPVWKPVEITSP